MDFVVLISGKLGQDQPQDLRTRGTDMIFMAEKRFDNRIDLRFEIHLSGIIKGQHQFPHSLADIRILLAVLILLGQIADNMDQLDCNKGLLDLHALQFGHLGVETAVNFL